MKTKKKGGCLKTILIIVLIFIAIGIISSIFSDDDIDKAPTDNNEQEEKNSDIEESDANKDIDAGTKSEDTPKVEPYEISLGSGHYQSGIDFPSGTYTIVATKGSGNVSSSNIFSGGLNETMATTEDDMYIKEFKNANLEKGVELNVSGNLIIKINTNEADTANQEKRKNDLTKEVELSSGNFIAGTDFPVGVYDVILVSGSGNVSSSNMYNGGLNEVMGTGDDMYIQEFKNAIFEEGTTLELSGVNIKLVPSK